MVVRVGAGSNVKLNPQLAQFQQSIQHHLSLWESLEFHNDVIRVNNA